MKKVIATAATMFLLGAAGAEARPQTFDMFAAQQSALHLVQHRAARYLQRYHGSLARYGVDGGRMTAPNRARFLWHIHVVLRGPDLRCNGSLRVTTPGYVARFNPARICVR